MRKIIPPLALLVTLTGCDILFPEDPRLGEEAQDACVARIEGALRLELAEAGGDPDAVLVPTYTYDITKLGLEEIQALSMSRSDETEGSRLNQSTNETSTAVDQFMEQSVDENGAFFLGRDPALYRVRGEARRFADIVAAGCERQQADMRLMAIDFADVAAEPDDAEETDTENPNENDN